MSLGEVSVSDNEPLITNSGENKKVNSYIKNISTTSSSSTFTYTKKTNTTLQENNPEIKCNK